MTHKERCAIPINWKEGDMVFIKGKYQPARVLYVYTNGYTMVSFPGKVIKGGIFNNDNTYGNEKIKRLS